MPSKELASPVLTVKLVLPLDASEHLVDQIELQMPTMRHSIASSKPDRRLAAVLAPDFSAFIQSFLHRVDGLTMILSDLDALFANARLQLNGLQILTSQRPNGERRVSFRFMKVVGDVHVLLLDAINPAHAESRAIAVEAIERVVGRTYDVACVAEQMRGFAERQTRFDGITRDIRSKQEELLFRLDLLQRAVAGRLPEGDRGASDNVTLISA